MFIKKIEAKSRVFGGRSFNWLVHKNTGIDHILKVSNIKSKILPNCLKGKYEYHLGEFSNT